VTDVRELIRVSTERVLAVFGQDEISDEFRAKIRYHTGLSTDEASTIQCVGMEEPISLLDLYQPTRIKQGATSVADLSKARQNALIYAGPGQGKTTLLRYLFLTEANGGAVVPLFFTLRKEEDILLLSEFIGILDNRRKLQRIPPKSDPILLLVDGYDEITNNQRKNVSDALNRYSVARAGTFILTCRSGYIVQGVKLKQYELDEFDRTDAIRLVDAFASAYASTLRIQKTFSGSSMIEELEDRKLTFIVSHPLMLTLACVVKSRVSPELPHNSVELLRQAMETLAFRWDESKGVKDRSTMTKMRSIHIMQCTMLVAYEMKGFVKD